MLLKASTISILLACFWTASRSQVASDLQTQYQLEIVKAVDKISIDGKLSEATWEQASTADDFWMSYPIDDQRVNSKNQTEVRMSYDDDFLYIAAECHGAGPYVIQSLKRDNVLFWSGDAFAVVLDPVNERQSGFYFGVNPANVQNEALVSGQTGRRGQSSSSGSVRGVNTAWDNKWYSKVAEEVDRWVVEIAIPFKTLRYSEKTVWGVNFLRGDARTNSYHTWSPVPVQFRGVDLGYTGSLQWDKRPPSASGNISLIPYASASTYRDFEEGTPADNSLKGGVDAKIAITSSLNLDITLNPDFSQVEVDQQVTNLTTFSIRFPERRLFFLENSDIFSDFGIPPMRPFFSRRIGLDSDNNTIPILFGARLSGNLNKDLRIGAMTMQTKDQELLPGENYTSLAFQQRLFGRSVIKGYFHNRQQYHDGEFMQEDFNRVGGLEFAHRSLDGKFQSFAGYGKSYQKNEYDDNYFYHFAVGYDGRNISAYTNWAGVGNNYEVDMGFIPRSYHYDELKDTSYRIGFHHNYTRIGYTFYPTENSKINSQEVGLRDVLDFTKGGKLIANRLEATYNILWQNSSMFEFSLTQSNAQLLFPFGFTDAEPLPVGKYSYQTIGAMYQSDRRKTFNYLAGFETGGFYNGSRQQYQLTLNYRIQPWGNFGLNFVQNNLEFPDPYGKENLFLIGPKIELAFSNDLFWTTFLQYNTQNDNFNINSRFQWRFQPLSDLFLVYTDNYAVEFWGPKNRALVAKVNYWINL